MFDAALTIPAIVILLGVLIFFHELGHFTVAKLFKVRVDEFAFGFGPKWIRLMKLGDTEYTIHPVPLGGFVKLAGMEPGQENMENGFLSKPWWTRWLVYFAGPFMSFVLAFLIFLTIPMTFGLPVKDGAMNVIDLVMPNSEAERIGLRSGDMIVSIDGKSIESGQEMLETIHSSPGKELEIVIDRQGHEMTLTGATESYEIEDGKMIGRLGFLPKQELQRVGFTASLRYSAEMVTAFLGIMAKVLPSSEVKDAVGGPLAIADATWQSVKRGAYGYLQLMGLLSLSLGVINLLPIPVVDGGQMVLLTVEGIRGRRLSPKTIEISTRIGLAMLATILLLVMYLDLGRIAAGKLFR